MMNDGYTNQDGLYSSISKDHYSANSKYQDQLYSSQKEEDEEPYEDDALLNLILGVQHYMTERAKIFDGKLTDSPLYNLQYKMYSYLRQRASEV
ncbi:hypothetical protein G6F56_005787 [Rhizopus delemar]|nr:hypothetical protein G6F56_005787 [Rhizopus delemar]